jgi:protein-S-isoprenylcysteine O-methyltransferase Ste14
MVAGMALELWTVAVLGWRRILDPTATPADAEQPALVLGGPFAIVRQPHALGLVVLLVGAALALRSAAAAVPATLAIGAVIATAVRTDRMLADRHGEAHARYRRAVPLLVPRLR